MGDETKENEVEHGNYDPLHATRKPSTARRVDEQPSQVVQMPGDESEEPEERRPRLSDE